MYWRSMLKQLSSGTECFCFKVWLKCLSCKPRDFYPMFSKISEMSHIEYSPSCILSKWWKGPFNPQRSKGKCIKNPTDVNSEWQKGWNFFVNPWPVHCPLTCSVPIPQFEQDTSPHLSIPQTSRKIERKRDGKWWKEKQRQKRERTQHIYSTSRESTNHPQKMKERRSLVLRDNERRW